MPVNTTVRGRLEAQGFCGLDEEALDELTPWMRWTYTLGMLVAVVGVAMTAPVDADILGFALGMPLILVAALASTTNLCIPSFIYNTVVSRLNKPAAKERVYR